MKTLIILLIFLPCLVFAQENIIRGKIIDAETMKPLHGANVLLQGTSKGAASGKEGEFAIKTDLPGEKIIIISFVGYDTKKINLAGMDISKVILIKLDPKIIPAQTVLVEGSLGKRGITPMAFSKITQKEIAKNYTVQDIPEYLAKLPSTTFYSENGNGIGYNYLSIRGFDQRRISVSVNGIPQNDPEDHNVYWLDFPDLLASTAVIQVQRGAGSGVIGYPAIGGSINILTGTFSNSPMTNFSASMGSFNTKKYSASFSSGLIDGKYSLYANLSQILSGGYRDNSWVKFNAYYLSIVRFDDKLTTQINFYGGPIADGLAYTGLPKFAIKDNNLRRANYSYWEADKSGYTYVTPRRPSEIENFSQPHYELLNELRINPDITFNSALFLVFGDGFFNFDGSWADTTYLRLTSEFGFHPLVNPENVLIKSQVDNTQYGWVPRISIRHNNGEMIIGGELRIHRSTHWGSIDFGENLPIGLTKDYRYYYYNGGKDIANGYIHEEYNINKQFNLLGELQFAYNKYLFYNEKYLNHNFSVKNIFFNPRIGVNYKFNEAQNIFFSFARVSDEPRLSNYYNGDESSGGSTPQFELNSDGSYNYSKPLVKPETMNDFELGSSYNNKFISVSCNLYYMLFENEIVKNGKVDIFGQPITGNMKRTLHSGVELSSDIKITSEFGLYLNFTYSSNKILDGNYYIDSQNFINLNGNRVSGFPNILTNFGITFNNSSLFLQLTGRYVGSFYSDNYDNNLIKYLTEYPGFVDYSDNKNDAYFETDFFASYSFKEFPALERSKVFIQINNIFGTLYSANAIGGEFFPAAGRNFLAGIKIGL